jgi:hypothetical protein
VYGLARKGASTVAADGAESAARARAGEGITNSDMDQDKERKVRPLPCEGRLPAMGRRAVSMREGRRAGVCPSSR